MKLKNTLLLAGICLGLTSCGTTYMITSGSENLRALTKITSGDNNSIDPGGSPESSVLFYVTLMENGVKNIYKKEVPTSPAQSQVTTGGVCINPTFCKTSDRIAFARLVNGQYDIYMMPATQGNALIPVTETNGVDELAPSISPDGTLVAYQRGYSSSPEAEIWVKNITTGENMLLGKGATPAISPDGTKIAFAKIEKNNTRNIWVMNLDGTGAKQLTVSKEEFAGFPKWSPSGNNIVFQSNKKKGNFDIFVIGADGSGLRQLTTNESEDLTPFWSGDGYIYMCSDRGGKEGRYQIWRFRYEDN